MFFQSLLNAKETCLNEFFELYDREYQSILEELRNQHEIIEEKLGGRVPERLPNIIQDRLRHSLIPNNIPGQYQVLHVLLIQSIRAAALLHDIGHPPFSHIVEFALKDVYKEYKTKHLEGKEKAQEFISIMSKYFEDNRKLHEQMGDEISEGILYKIIPTINPEMDYEENLFELLVLETVKRIFAEKGAFSYLHRIVDSSLDGDRLDYVIRDVISSGMDAGMIEYGRIMSDIKMMMKEGEVFFCVPLKAVHTIEDFIKRRYNSYKDIIYHHRVVKTDYILEEIVKNLVRKYLEGEANEAPSGSEVLIPFDISGLWFPLGDKKSAIKANALSQWNDSWLMTVLRQIYYMEYYHNTSIPEDSKEYVLAQRLAELLRNSKRYHSLIKRSENFKVIDDAVKSVLNSHIVELTKRVEALREKGCHQANLLQQMLDIASKNSAGFVLSFLSRHSKEAGYENFEAMISEIVREETNHIVTNLKTYDTVTLFKRISIGMDAPIYLYNNKGAIFTLDDVSGIRNILQYDSNYLPAFYIYILAKDQDGLLKENREELLESIGIKIGEALIK